MIEMLDAPNNEVKLNQQLFIPNITVRHVEQDVIYDEGMSSLQERINELFNDQPEKKAADLARFAKISRSAVSDWRSGKTKTISGENAFSVAKFFGVNPEWVQTGNGKKYQPSTIAPSSNAEWLGGFDLWDDSTPLRDDEVALPFFREIELSAGSGRHAVQENHGYKLRFAKSTLRKKGVSADHAACVTVSGNSMEPVYPDGCTIGIDTSKNRLVDGDIFAIDHDGELRVKVLYRLPGGGVRLRSFNTVEYPDENYSAEEATKIRILGRVFWWSALR
jgi:phage repressor protein C with HTH and peptisase S24 domain